MSKTITLTDEQFEKVESVLKEAKGTEKKGCNTVIYKIDGSVLYESEKETVKEAVEEAVGSGAYLSGAYLSGADLSEADLSGAYLREADLSGADLSGAYLREAYLSGADLSGADLSEAELYKATFYGRGGTQKLKKDQVEDFLNALGFQVE